MAIKIILTGATGMVGEGVLLECLGNPAVSEVLCVNRRPVGRTHPKLKEYLVPDFTKLDVNDAALKGYDACFFCAGVTSIGKDEPEYTKLTYDTTLAFAKAVLQQNPGMSFIYVSGAGTDSTEKGKVMWARVKGKTENDLAKLPFKRTYNFRPGFMKAMPGQKNTLKLYNYLAWLYPVLKLFFPGSACTLREVGRAMIHCVTKGTDKQIISVRDMVALAK